MFCLVEYLARTGRSGSDLPEDHQLSSRRCTLTAAVETAVVSFRRAAAARRWGGRNLAASPAVFGIATAKGGSHLLIQALRGLAAVGPFFDAAFRHINRSADAGIPAI